MPRPSRLKLPPIDLGDEDLSERIARLRKERGCTQVELAEKIGITQGLVSAYECGTLGMQVEMLARFAEALRVSADALLGLKANGKAKDSNLSLKLTRRMQKIEALPPSKQKLLLGTIDNFLKGAKR